MSAARRRLTSRGRRMLSHRSANTGIADIRREVSGCSNAGIVTSFSPLKLPPDGSCPSPRLSPTGRVPIAAGVPPESRRHKDSYLRTTVTTPFIDAHIAFAEVLWQPAGQWLRHPVAPETMLVFWCPRAVLSCGGQYTDGEVCRTGWTAVGLLASLRASPGRLPC
jgi:hypothetical protein